MFSRLVGSLSRTSSLPAFSTLVLACMVTGLPVQAGVLNPFSPSKPAYSVDQQVACGPNDLIEISNVSGSVRVIGTAERQVRVVGTIGEGTEEFIFQRRGNGVVVKVEIHDGPRMPWNRVNGSDLTVYVPATNQVTLSTVSADVQTQQLGGMVRIQVVSGDVRVQDMRGPVSLRTVSGDAMIVTSGTAVDVNTVSGDVALQMSKNAERVQVETVSGSVRMSAPTVQTIHLNSVSGDLEIQADPGNGGLHAVNSKSGDIHWTVSSSSQVAVDASTMSGEMSILGVNGERGSKHGWSSQHAFKQVGSGSARVHLSTFSGDVTVDTH